MAQAARLNLRMQKEIKQLMTDPPPGVALPILSQSSNLPFSSLSTIQAQIEGPDETVYAKGIFTLKIQIPERYPFNPPIVTFVTPIYHPNIDNGGRICLDILNLPPKGAWQPSMNISTVLLSIRLLLSEPNPDDALMAETSKEYKYNRQVFDEKARTWTEKYANLASSGKSDSGTTSIGTTVPQETKRTNTFHEIPVKESDRCRKKLCLTSQIMSPSTVASTDIDNDEEYATILPQSPISEKQAHSSQFLQNAGTKLENLKPHDMNEKFPVKSKKFEASSKLETIIVSDSEESDNENARPSRSRLSLMRKPAGRN